MSNIRLGIAAYVQLDAYGTEYPPHWALVAHLTDFASDDVRVYQIKPGNGAGAWVENHKQCRLQNATNLIGVVDLGFAKMSMQEFDNLARMFDPERGREDPRGSANQWGCASWCICVLHYAEKTGSFYLGCTSRQLYDLITPEFFALKRIQTNSLKTVRFP